MTAIFGLGELLFLVIEVIGTLLFGKRRKRVPPPEEHPPAVEAHPPAVEAHTVSAPAPGSSNE
jgi:hypothetical protein